jgi:hypothetical protein
MNIEQGKCLECLKCSKVPKVVASAIGISG